MVRTKCGAIVSYRMRLGEQQYIPEVAIMCLPMVQQEEEQRREGRRKRTKELRRVSLDKGRRGELKPALLGSL